MPAWRKMALMAEMSQTVKMLSLAGLRQRHPSSSSARRRIHGRRIPRETPDWTGDNEQTGNANAPLVLEAGRRHLD
jgi:hypothetical protein